MLGPVQAILLAFPVALFTAAVVSDITYLRTAEIQWSNFSSWLIAGGLFFGGFVALLALISFLGSGRRHGRRLTYLLLLVAMWVIGFINALLHSRDAWYSVTPMGAFLSVVTALLVLIAAWIGYSAFPREEIHDARA
jgi:uncharacterized membrane protein